MPCGAVGLFSWARSCKRCDPMVPVVCLCSRRLTWRPWPSNANTWETPRASYNL